MAVIGLETTIAAPIERCFDLTRDVATHLASTARTRERVVAGRTAGLMEQGDEVTWEAVHLGLRRRLTVRIVRCERPHFLEDEQVRGPFVRFRHRHEFSEGARGTLMVDQVDFASPLGPLGRAFDALYLERYLRAFLRERADAIKRTAERAA